MHVALCLFRYFPHGGMQRDLMATAVLLRERGHEVTVYCHTWDAAEPAEFAVEVLRASGRSNHARARSFTRALAERLRAARPDVVVGFDKMPGLDLYFAADPCYVARTATRPWPYRLTPRYRVFQQLEAAVFGESGAQILLLDERERATYQRCFATPDRRFTSLPPGVAADRRHDEHAAERRRRGRAALGLDQDAFVLLVLAANFELKGLDRALLALSSLPEELRARTHLLAVGEGASPRWSRAAADLGLAETCTFSPARDDVPDLLQAADLLVHAARRDTTGTVLMEAAVAGLPSLCTAACGYAARVEAAGAGVVLGEPFEQNALDRALLELRSADLGPLKAAALRYAASVDLHAMHARIVDATEQVYSERGAT